ERHRQVVDTVEAQVLEHLDGGALARAGEASHHHEAELGHMMLGARPVLARLPPRSAPPMPPIQRPRGSRRAQLDASRRRPPSVLVAGLPAPPPTPSPSLTRSL